MQLAVHPNLAYPSSARSLNILPYSPLRPRTTGASTMKAGLLRQLQHLLHHLLRRRGGDREAADVAVRPSGAGVQEAEVVVDLRDGRHRRARVVGGGLLVYGDGRREAVYVVHVRFVHLAEELPGVGREALDVAALSLGVDGVEGQGRFAAPGESGHDDHHVPRQRNGNVLQVVFPSPVDDVIWLSAMLALLYAISYDPASIRPPDGRPKSLLLLVVNFNIRNGQSFVFCAFSYILDVICKEFRYCSFRGYRARRPHDPQRILQHLDRRPRRRRARSPGDPESRP